MKDAKGHGSNPRGIASVRHKVKDPTWTGTVITHGSKPVVSGGQPKSSNAQAAEALASALKSTQAPVHEAMRTAAFQEKDPAKLSEKLEKAYRAEHGWSGDVGKHKGG